MIKIIFKILLTLLILVITLVAFVEVYPNQMKKLESKVGIQVVTPVQDFLGNMRSEIDKARDKDYQRDIEDIVNNEIIEL